MKIAVRESAMVKPAEETPMIMLWNSNLDRIVWNDHTLFLYFYRSNKNTSNFFDAKVMKEALSRVLVPFFPVAGRLREDQDGQDQEINCQGQGALFVEAESDGVIDDFGDFAPRLEFLKLFPTVDRSLGVDLCPLLIVQITYFKCGGVSLGIGMLHHLADGTSMMHFINSWSEMARGLDLSLPPFIDRTLLRARDPPQPVFEHTEFQQVPSMEYSLLNSDETITSMFKLTPNQLNVLKEKSKETSSKINFTLFEILAGHIWRSVCKARGLQGDQETTLYFPANGRARFQPALPPGYFGNAVFMVNPKAEAEKIQSSLCVYATNKIHDALALRNNNYLKSVIDYLELVPDLKAWVRRFDLRGPNNLIINSWTRLGIHEADFGWGRPIYMGPAYFPVEGMVVFLPSPINDESISIAISLQAQDMKLFRNILYDI